MNVGIPKERRPFEYRVGLSPAGVEILVQQGHTVYIEHEAGAGAGFADREYEQAGGQIVYEAQEALGRSDLLLKVTRPLEDELEWINSGATVMGLLHLAAARQERVDAFLRQKISTVAYEQVQLADGSLPVLRPFSEIGGQMVPQIAARLLQSNGGGKGILLGGIPGVPPAEVTIIGAGVLGSNATAAFLGLGAHVTVLDKDLGVLQRVHARYPQIVSMIATQRNIERACAYADVVLTAVLVPGERAPIVITRETLKRMKPRSVLIDMSIDEGGAAETSRPTTHDQPTFVEQGVTHFCVPNVPGVVARTATHAFVNAAMPYIMEIANLGIEAAIRQDPALELAINTHRGELRHLHRWTSQEGAESE